MPDTDNVTESKTLLVSTTPGLAGDAPESDSIDTPCRATLENEAANSFWIALHQVLMRIGWIFKTESIIIPYFMDLVGGGPALRGSLMVFNRLGFSLPPALFAHRLKSMPQKRWAVAAGTFGMAIPFALLSLVWGTGVWKNSEGEPAFWMPYFFLIVYGLFFAITGINQLAAHSINGKLIRAERRGRLFAAGVAVGAPLSILAAWYYMPRWFALPDGGFTWLFLAPAIAFALASLTMLAVKEENDSFDEVSPPAWRRLNDAWQIIVQPGPCHGVAIVALLYSTTFTLFPHYQALATDRANESAANSFDISLLLTWTITQHISVAVLSLLVGPIADRFGNRLAIKLLLFGSTISPITAIALAQLPAEQMNDWFWLVFAPLGFTPVTIKMLINYTLEMVPREEHPRYISAIGICFALPVILGSTLVGWLIGQFGSVPIFALGASVLVMAGIKSFSLVEPRHEN